MARTTYQAPVFPLLCREVPVHIVNNAERRVQPVVRRPGEIKLGSAQTVCNTLECVAKTVGKVICGVNLPLVAGSVVRFVKHTIGSKIPHLGVSTLDILLHAQECSSRLVFAIPHIAEFSQVFLWGLISVRASEPRRGTISAPALSLQVFVTAVANVGLAKSNKLFRLVIELLKVIRGVGDPIRLVPKPSNHVLYGCEVYLLLRFGIRIVKTQIACPSVVLGEAKVDGDGFAVTYA